MPVDYADPVADSVLLQWAPTPSGAHWSKVAKAVRQPAVPDTTTRVDSGIINLGTTRIDEFVMDSAIDLAGGRATQITVWVYGSRASTAQFNTNIAPSTGAFVGRQALATPALFSSWMFATFSGLTWTQAQLNGFRVRLGAVGSNNLGEANDRAFAVYAEVTHAVDFLCGEVTAQGSLSGAAQ